MKRYLFQALSARYDGRGFFGLLNVSNRRCVGQHVAFRKSFLHDVASVERCGRQVHLHDNRHGIAIRINGAPITNAFCRCVRAGRESRIV